MKPWDARPAKYEDLLTLLKERGEAGNHERIASARFLNGPAITFLDDNQNIVAVAGATIFWSGMGEIWLIRSKYWELYKREIVHVTGKYLDLIQKNGKLTRLQAIVVADSMENRRYVEHYGFQAEGTLKKYDVLGRDCIMYSRIREVKA